MNTTKRIVIHRGGTRSGKTYGLLKSLSGWLFTGILRKGEVIESGTALVVRKHASTLKGTVMKDFEFITLNVAAAFGLNVNYNRTNRTFTFQGRTVEFIGADDEQKLRGRKSAILYCNEGNELNYRKEFFQLLIRCTGPVFIDFNPSDPYVWIKTELEDQRAHTKGDVETIVSTYKDNPYLNKEQVAEIEALEESDPALWAVYGLGEYGKVEGLIIPGITIIDDWPATHLRQIGIGIDFGFTNSYTAAYRCGLWEPRRLFTDELIYSKGLTDNDIVQVLNDLGVSKREPIVADSAQPGSITTIRRAGFNIKGVKKPKNSVSYGIGLMRGKDIHATGKSQGFIREQKLYKYKQHSNGQWLNEPEKGNDHAMDAIRYYLMSTMGASKKLQFA